MFHPEKPQFEFKVNNRVGNINHDQWAIIVSQYFANFFVNETRNNCFRFKNKLEESEHLIYNYNKYLEYTGNDEHSSFEETYSFPESVNAAIPGVYICMPISYLIYLFLSNMFIAKIFL